MNNLMQIVDQRDILGKEFKIYGDFENPLFLAKDVAVWIDYDISSVHKLINVVEETEKVRKNVPTLGGEQEMWFVTEDGLYEILMQSRKPIAKMFKKKVKEILKEIRKTGGYSGVPKTFGEALRLAADLEEQNQLLLQEKAENEPKVKFADAVANSDCCISVEEFAKITYNQFRLGRNLMFAQLRGMGILQSSKYKKNIPYQKYIDMGIFKVSEEVLPSDYIVTTTWITGKGQKYLLEKLGGYK